MSRTPISIDMAQIVSILRAIAGQLDFRGVISAAATEIKTLLPHDHLDVAILDSRRTMVSAYETGLHTEWDAATTATKPVRVSPIRPLLQGKVDHILTDDAQTDPRFHLPGAFSRPIFAAGLHARLHVPLVVERRVIGALSFSTQQVGTYLPGDVANARMVAEILSSYFFALRQSELVRQSQMQQVEAEARAEGLRIGALSLTEELENARQAIGMDLHDQTLADLTRIARGLQRAADRPSLRGAELQPLQDEIEHCLRELRIIIDNAKPSVLQFFGFGQAVEALLERSVASATGLSYRLNDDGAARFDDLPPTILVSLYRIVQEAINNAVRHAQASRIVISLDLVPAGRRVVIADNGIGLGLTPGRRIGGLANMRTRASLVEAELAITEAEGGGTRLEILLPALAVPVSQPLKVSQS